VDGAGGLGLVGAAGRSDDAEGKAHVLLDEFRDARDVAFPDFSNVEAVAAE